MKYGTNNMTKVVIAPAEFVHCRTEVAVMTRDADLLVTICVRTGAASLQTYATAAELLELAAMFERAADADAAPELAGISAQRGY